MQLENVVGASDYIWRTVRCQKVDEDAQNELISGQLCGRLALLRDPRVWPEPRGGDPSLSLRYGHFPYLLWSGTRAMDASFRRFRRGQCAE